MSKINDGRRHSRWVHLLPSLHLSLCLAYSSGAVDAGGLMITIDHPISVLMIALEVRYHLPDLLVWGVIGTLWWYLLSLGAEYLVR